MGKISKARSRPTPYDRHAKSSSSNSKNAAAAAAGIAKNLNFKFNTKDYGQHILKNPGIADEIVKKAHIIPSDTVLEVGPGTGNITVRLLKEARKVIACELDPRMAAEVTKRVQGTPEQQKIDIIVGDVIRLPELPPHDVLVSNTPYVISSPLVFKVLAMKNPPRSCVLMFQREFAQRLVAKPGDNLYSRLSVNVQFFAKTTHVMKVGKNNFKPPPNVESDVVRIEPKTGSARPTIAFDEFDGLLRVCFNRKNKTLRASWLGTKEVMVMCEKNYRTYCAMNNIPIDTSLVEGAPADEDDDADMDAAPSAVAEDDGMEVDNEDDDTPSFFKELAAAKTAAESSKTPSKRPKTKVAALVREKIRRVLEDVTGLADKRARMLDETDFLKLLLAFHKEGMHFS